MSLSFFPIFKLFLQNFFKRKNIKIKKIEKKLASMFGICLKAGFKFKIQPLIDEFKGVSISANWPGICEYYYVVIVF